MTKSEHKGVHTYTSDCPACSTPPPATVSEPLLPWANAGGPNECVHGYAEGIKCPRCAIAPSPAPVQSQRDDVDSCTGCGEEERNCKCASVQSAEPVQGRAAREFYRLYIDQHPQSEWPSDHPNLFKFSEACAEHVMTIRGYEVKERGLLAIVAEQQQEIERLEDSFKNFHRSLCDRFDYVHDPVDWRRDQVSLEEHIAHKLAERYLTIQRLHNRLTHISFVVTGNDAALEQATPQEVDKLLKPLTDASAAKEGKAK